MNTPRNDSDLPGLLQQWQVSPVHSAHFSSDVWRSIDVRRQRESWAGFAKGHPAMLAALIIVATIAGGWGGMESARSRVEHQSSAMADAYVQGMDARQMTMP